MAMQTLLVANPKGGSGKTTLATNIAGWLAGKQAAGRAGRLRSAALGDRVARAPSAAVSGDRRLDARLRARKS